MRRYTKKDFPTGNVRRFLEPGPIVLVSSAHADQTNIMTMGWHMVMEFTPSLVGCLISSGNHSYEMVSRSKQCVINVPTIELAEKVVGIGNCSGAEVDKFTKFKLTAVAATKVKAPLIAECFANLECRLVDGRLRDK
jgi:flavin reductase (DIM6/NTAB) family NADH-FMN oxidoreductase RutF